MIEAIFNRHKSDFRCDMTIEFNVKLHSSISISDEDWNFEQETCSFTNRYASLCFNEIQKSNYKWLKDWSFAGRMNGWFVLLCDEVKLRDSTIYRIENIVKKYYNNYTKEIEKYYGRS